MLAYYDVDDPLECHKQAKNITNILCWRQHQKIVTIIKSRTKRCHQDLSPGKSQISSAFYHTTKIYSYKYSRFRVFFGIDFPPIYFLSKHYYIGQGCYYILVLNENRTISLYYWIKIHKLRQLHVLQAIMLEFYEFFAIWLQNVRVEIHRIFQKKSLSIYAQAKGHFKPTVENSWVQLLLHK